MPSTAIINLEDTEGMKWADDQLLIHAPDARAYYNQFLMEEKTSGNAKPETSTNCGKPDGR
jgi:hypothetical protein